MHFFHPIQQCAQQIYHTALPLSPTSSPLQKSYLQHVTDDQPSLVSEFIGAPSDWGFLLRTIDPRPRRPTCITTSRQGIVAACEDIVNIYDIVTGVLQQSLPTPEIVTKIEGSPDGSILYLVHSFSVTMCDVQTGGLSHTFTTKSEIDDVAVSPTGDHIACGLSNGTVALWNIHTKEEGEGFGNSKSVVAISWLSPLVLAIVTQSSLYFHNIDIGKTWDGLSFSGCAWGMVHLIEDEDENENEDEDEDEYGYGHEYGYKHGYGDGYGYFDDDDDDDEYMYPYQRPCLPEDKDEDEDEDEDEDPDEDENKDEDGDGDGDGDDNENQDQVVAMGRLLVGTSQPASVGASQELCSFEVFRYKQASSSQQPKVTKYEQKWKPQQRGPLMHLGQLTSPTLMGAGVWCITPPSGVKVFDTDTGWTENLSPLDAATSVADSSSDVIVVQTKDSIQIFSRRVRTSQDARGDKRVSHIYSLDENHIICVLQSTRHLTLFEKLDTVQEINPGDATLSLGSLLTNQSPSPCASLCCGLVAEFGISAVMEALRSRTLLPEWTSAADEDMPLGGLSPECTRIVTVYGSPRQELQVKDCKDGNVLANLPLEGDFRTGEIYDLTFDSETRFRLKVDGSGRHVQIPYEITESPSGQYSHTIIKGESVSLSEPHEKPPYTLDANCEWVLDARSRRICWISPEDIRKGNGGHFWAGTSLVMLGEDGVVRKVSFKEPDC